MDKDGVVGKMGAEPPSEGAKPPQSHPHELERWARSARPVVDPGILDPSNKMVLAEMVLGLNVRI